MRIIILSIVLSLLFSCHEKRNSEHFSSSKLKKEQKTQALLLTQPFEYDTADKNKVTGAYVPNNNITIPKNLATQSKWIMFEGPVLENDLVAYRYYADSRHRFDVFGKTVEDLVMDTVSWQYHDLMDWGSDILKVGNSLGLGSPAIYYQDSLYTLSDCAKKEIEIINSGPQASSIKTTFTNLRIGPHTFDLVQDWSIETGKPWSEINLKVPNGQLPEGMRFATGIVKHLPEVMTKTNKTAFSIMNWGKQSFHGENMGMAIVCDRKFEPKMVDDELSHVVVFELSQEEVTYRFLSIWEKDRNKVKSSKNFESLVTDIKFSKN